MRIQILADNRTLHAELEYEHGLCIYLDTDKHKILLDCGASDIFIKNAIAMEIDLVNVDYVFISHGHLDHIGGLDTFLKINSKARVIISDKALNQQFFSIRHTKRNISNHADLSPYFNRFIFVDSDFEVENTISVYKNISTRHFAPKANSTLMKSVNNSLEPDNFDHELIFAYGEQSLIVYSGCAHAGLLNILDTVQEKSCLPIEYVIGGFHLVDGNFELTGDLHSIAGELKKDYPNTKFMTGHCTGEKAYTELKTVLGEKLNYFYSGFTYIDNFYSTFVSKIID